MIREANRFWLKILDIFGMDGVTLPWRVVYIRPEHIDNIPLRRHETVHLNQLDRDGPVWWTIKYAYYLIRYGYRANPYEIEAYQSETAP